MLPKCLGHHAAAELQDVREQSPPPTTFPLPDDPVLALAASAVRDTGHWGWVVDPSWNLTYLTYLTYDHRLSFGAGKLAELPFGGHLMGPEPVAAYRRMVYGLTTTALAENMLRTIGEFMLAGASGHRTMLRRSVAPELAHIVDELEPDYRTVASLEIRVLTSSTR